MRTRLFIMLLASIVLAAAALAQAEGKGGTIHLRYGWSEQADTWWEEGNILFYEYRGERHGVPLEDVVKIEGTPKPRSGASGKTDPNLAAIQKCRYTFPNIGDPDSKVIEWAKCAMFGMVKVNTTIVRGLVKKQFVVGPHPNPTYWYSENGIITGIQY